MTASCPATDVATLCGSRMLPSTACTFGAGSATREGSRTMAVTVCPRLRASRRIRWPMVPLAPNNASFIIHLLLWPGPLPSQKLLQNRAKEFRGSRPLFHLDLDRAQDARDGRLGELLVHPPLDL